MSLCECDGQATAQHSLLPVLLVAVHVHAVDLCVAAAATAAAELGQLRSDNMELAANLQVKATAGAGFRGQAVTQLSALSLALAPRQGALQPDSPLSPLKPEPCLQG